MTIISNDGVKLLQFTHRLFHQELLTAVTHNFVPSECGPVAAEWGIFAKPQ